MLKLQHNPETFVLGRPRYINGLLLSTGQHWSYSERAALARFSAERAPMAAVAITLGRSETSIAHKAIEFLGAKRIPYEWKLFSKPIKDF